MWIEGGGGRKVRVRKICGGLKNRGLWKNIERSESDRASFFDARLLRLCHIVWKDRERRKGRI